MAVQQAPQFLLREVALPMFIVHREIGAPTTSVASNLVIVAEYEEQSAVNARVAMRFLDEMRWVSMFKFQFN